MSTISRITLVLLGILVSGCASLPTGPSVMVLPGTGNSFEQFRADDAICRQYAYSQVGGQTPNQAAVNSGVTSAAVGTGVGAAAGAAIGGATGAAVGAGVGLAAGSAAGTGAYYNSMYGLQHHYDVAYIQCMYSKGNQVPVYGQFSNVISQQPARSSANIPPPPPGSPPPPPSK